MKTQLGQEVTDTITGFKGIVVGRVEYITGCHQLLVQPPMKSDGDFVESRWFDEDRTAVTNDEPISLRIENAGPDKQAPRR
jgi:hypothetical protein